MQVACPAEPARRALAGVVGLLLTAGCTATADMQPAYTPGAASAAIQRKAAVDLGRGFAGHTFAVEYGGGFEMEVPLGAASGPLICQVFEARFSELARPCGKVPEDSAGISVIEPRLESFALHELGGRDHRYQADLRYRFAIHGQDGREIAGWAVHGTGHWNLMENPWSLTGKPDDAIERALESLATNLEASFAEAPEAVRWLDGRPLDSATAPRDRQRLATDAEAGTRRISTYDGVVAVTADLADAPDPESEFIVADLRGRGAVSMRLAIENLSNGELLVERGAIRVEGPGRAAVHAISGELLASKLVRRGVRIPGVTPPPGTGAAGAVAVLIAALHNYSVAEGEAAEASVYRLLYQSGQLAGRARLAPGERTGGYVHFYLPAQARRLGDASLLVPVIDLATATRYVAVIPLGEG